MIIIDDARCVAGLLQAPKNARICYVLAHGAGTGMSHPFMVAVADGLAERGIATLRYQFPYMEHGSKRPDAPKLAQATVRAAVAQASHMLPKLGLVAGGKSFGGRMTSRAHAESPLPGVRGLAFLGFPLHAAGRPSEERGTHLFEVQIPMLFLQGARDALADADVMEKLVQRLGPRATLKLLSDADHSFHVPARSGRKDEEVRAELLDTLAAWIETMV
ncbi:MAG: alpha/beta family hydrolase [Methyloceanibacter sp.]